MSCTVCWLANKHNKGAVEDFLKENHFEFDSVERNTYIMYEVKYNTHADYALIIKNMQNIERLDPLQI
jgi:hypothetical protein